MAFLLFYYLQVGVLPMAGLPPWRFSDHRHSFQNKLCIMSVLNVFYLRNEKIL
jgi:hypothetical protein